ncbi:MAG: serine/threonine protein kinase [Candidatus Nealsonbacteria bacterium]|nr:serine/threonine protein kinase [Candidatus Nealsonbacteria bacterium]
MEKQVEFVELDGQDEMDVTAADPDDPTPGDPATDRPATDRSAPKARPAAKFVYPGGSQPLDGYTIKRGVGHGGFGEIYFAVSDAGKEVALKLIRRNLDIELRGVRHCLNLKHPNLLSLFDIREDARGDTWVVMEFVAGACLADVVATHPDGLPTEEALTWFHGLSAGVAYLHDRGIVHRDLKPGNIFSDEGIVKVGDYGLSKFVSCSRRSGQTESVGTVHYMAPEVANGRYGKEIDIYALGVVLYELLTGRVPFEGESVGEVLMKHLTARPDVSALAEPYRSVIARALEKDPAKRFASVGEMTAALPQPEHPQQIAGQLPSGSFGSAGAAAGVAGAAAGQSPFAEEAAAASPFAEEVVWAETVDEEPIYMALRDTVRRGRDAWDHANFATPVKVVILVMAMILLAVTAQIWLPLGVLALLFYGGYRIVRMIVMPGGSSTVRVTRPTGPPPIPPARPARPRVDPALAKTQPGGRGRYRHRETPAPAMVLKTPQERLTELLGSLLLSAVVATAMCVVMVLLNSYQSATPSAQQCAWLGLVSVAGAWAVLIPSKLWEGVQGETTPRRFVMMVVGLGLGALAFGVATMLMVDLLHYPEFPHDGGRHFPSGFYAVGQPLAMAQMACFGTLFLLMRWWRQADPLRSSRLSLWSVVVSAAAAALVAAIWGFPQPWLIMAAGAISVSVQLASPWVHPHRRYRRQQA